jgi:hypothetical protein
VWGALGGYALALWDAASGGEEDSA